MSGEQWGPVVTLDTQDVQGLLVSGYGSMHEARYLFLRVADADRARAWVGDLAQRVTNSAAPEDHHCVNVAFTPDGLAALGLSRDELRTFAPPFHEGMTAPHRRRLLGDVDGNDPDRWAWGGTPGEDAGKRADRIHVLLLLFARNAKTIVEVETDETARFVDGGLEQVHAMVPEPLPGRVNVGKFGVEHFGFADGMSQPVIRGSGQEHKLGGDDWRRTVIEAGEFVLGYPNGYGKVTPWPKLSGRGAAGDDFGRNGSFLVVRQLAQDVAGFWQAMNEATGGTGDQEQMTWLASKLVGRWPSGAPLVWSQHKDDPVLGAENGFGYASIDPHGERCPLGSHIRRANPRDALGTKPAVALELANLHRIIRRGRVYGTELTPDTADEERGLFFMCVNANIERQFEFVQHTWLNNPKFDGLYDEADPLMAGPADWDANFTVQDSPVRRRLRDLPRFVTTRGGAYLFLPGIRALRMLARAPA